MKVKLNRYLKKHNINYVEYNHQAVFTVEESRDLKKEIPGLHCKTLFLKDNFGKFYLFGLPGEKKLDSRKFRKLVGAKKIRFGTKEELKSEVDLVPGSVSIFGVVNSDTVVLVLDKEVWDAKKVGFHPNLNTSTLVLEHEDLKKFYDSLRNKKYIR